MIDDLSEDDWLDDVIGDDINEDDWRVETSIPSLKQTVRLEPPEEFVVDATVSPEDKPRRMK